MKGSRRLGWAAAAFGALFVVVGLGVAICAIRGCGLGTCTLGHAFGWLVPLTAALVLGGATWLLLGQPEDTGHEYSAPAAAECASCRREILGQWRMCPYCGSLLGEQPPHVSVTSAVDASAE